MIENPLIYRDIFYIDGSLRDIYIQNTNEQDWQTLLNFLRTSSYPLELFVGQELQPIPEQVADLFRLEEERGVSLNIDEKRLALHCHFFIREEIEFDLDPADFQNAQQVAPLLDFIRAIGHLLQKTVDLTPEDGASFPLFRFNPETGEETWFLAEA